MKRMNATGCSASWVASILMTAAEELIASTGKNRKKMGTQVTQKKLLIMMIG